MLLFGDAPLVRLALTDFGLAATPQLTHSHGGTPCYKAPEQVLCEPLKTAGRDIWAAGMVLARLLGGVHTEAAVGRYRDFSKSRMRPGQMFKRAREISEAVKADSSAERLLRCSAMRRRSFSNHSASRCKPCLDDDISSVRREVALLLQRCFDKELRRPSAGECRAILISLWERHLSWNDYESTLQPPRKSPCVYRWEGTDRASMFHEVCKYTTELLLSRYNQAPDSVKTHREIKRFLHVLKKRKARVVKNILDYYQQARQQKYQCGETSSSSVSRPLSSTHVDITSQSVDNPSSSWTLEPTSSTCATTSILNS